MSTTIGEYFADTVKHWYVFLIIGILFVVTGIWTFTSPKDGYLVLSVLFSISFIVSGIMGMVFAIANNDIISSWIWVLVFSGLSVIIGSIMLFHPEVSMLTLGIFVGFNVLIQASVLFAMSIEMKEDEISDWWIVLILGILGAILGCMLMLNPDFAGITIALWTGVAFIILGILYIYSAFSLKGIKKDAKNVKKKVQAAAEEAQAQMDAAE